MDWRDYFTEIGFGGASTIFADVFRDVKIATLTSIEEAEARSPYRCPKCSRPCLEMYGVLRCRRCDGPPDSTYGEIA